MAAPVSRAISDTISPYTQKAVSPVPPEVMRMDRNESAFGPSPKAAEAVASQFSRMGSYPENSAIELRRDIAAELNIHPDQIIIGSGSYELLQLACEVYLDPGEECIVPAPSFIWYEKFSRVCGGAVVTVPLADMKISLDAMLDAVSEKTKIIWLVNPENPTGTLLSAGELDGFLGRVPSDVLVVIDEAYIEFADRYDPKDSVALVNQYDNVLLLRTFSKFFGLASIRIGYGISTTEVINNLIQYRIPPNHSRLSAAAAKAAWEDKAYYAGVRERFLAERAYFEQELTRLGLEFIPTQGNFILIGLKRESAGLVKLLKDHGVLVKSGAEFGFSDRIRITIGNHAFNTRFFSVVERYLNTEV